MALDRISCLQNSLQDTTIIALSCLGSNVFRPSRLLPLATYGHTYIPPSVILLLRRILLLHRTGATLPFYLSAVCFLLHTQPMYSTSFPPPFQSNNSLQPLGDSPNLCVISKRPAWPTFILDPLFSFLFLFLLGWTKCIVHTERHVMTCCAQKATAVYSPDDSHLCLHAIERDEETDAAWHPPLLYVQNWGVKKFHVHNTISSSKRHSRLSLHSKSLEMSFLATHRQGTATFFAR